MGRFSFFYTRHSELIISRVLAAQFRQVLS